MHFADSKVAKSLSQKLDNACSEQKQRLNGSQRRPVYGSLYRSEQNMLNSISLDNETLDERQSQLRKLIGDVNDNRRSSMTKVESVEVKSLAGGNPLIYKHCPATTCGMEELLEMKQDFGGEVAHLVMHLDDTQTLKAQSSDGKFNWFKGRISRALRRALGSSSKGFFVLERDKQNWAEKLALKKPGLHIHAVIYSPDGFDLPVRQRIKRSFRELISNKSSNNSLMAQTTRTRHRVSDSDPSSFYSEVSDLDLGVADYLCKELDRPIVEGCCNLSFFNMGNQVNVRRQWRYEQLQAMRLEREQIERDILYGRDVGDVDKRLTRAIDSVPRPKELVTDPHKH